MLTFLSIILLSISSMFSYGSRESSDCRECNEVVMDFEPTLNKKEGFNGNVRSYTNYFFMPIEEFIPHTERMLQMQYYLFESDKATPRDGVTSGRYNLELDADNYNFNYSVTFDYSNPSQTDLMSYGLLLYPNYSQVILNPSFIGSLDTDYAVKTLTFSLETSPYYPNYYNVLTYEFVTRLNLTYTYKIIVYFNPLTNGGNNQYNPNITDIQVGNSNYLIYYNGELTNDMFGVAFRSSVDNPFYLTYQYQSTPNQDIWQNGFNAGVDAGNQDYYNNGYEAGFTQGQSTRSDTDYNAGYEAGLIDAGGTNPQMNSIFQGIFEVGLLPINVFLTIFNFEVFGINVSGLVSGLLTMSVIIIIVRFLFGGKKDD